MEKETIKAINKKIVELLNKNDVISIEKAIELIKTINNNPLKCE